mmetsp:Transcript_5370/g.12597  ORF Transcript_5370/g.12597 Transcript_5370/m.12597 type:complete len:339 (-) Transcript_5370:124-1140(-)
MVASSKSALLLGAAAAIGLSEAFSPAPMALGHSRASSIAAAASSPALRAERSGIVAATMARESFVAGNWKCNPVDINEAKSLATAVIAEAKTAPGQVAIFVPHPFVKTVADLAEGSNVEVGGQNMFVEDSGAYTGAISAHMLKSVGAKHVLVGHSERRATFGASEELINSQVLKALAEGLKPLLCIGETKEEYESGLNTKVCALQIAKGLKGVTKEQMKDVTIAYEPVWAIGTGLVCDTSVAQDVHASIRSFLAEIYDNEVADSVRIQYGGSVTPESVDELMGKPDIDGCLVGGASLDASKFQRIMNYEPFDGKGATPFGGKPGGFREMMWKAMSNVE